MKFISHIMTSRAKFGAIRFLAVELLTFLQSGNELVNYVLYGSIKPREKK